jgi:mRNA interferase MazF
MKPDASPLRGEVWLINLDPVRGHEQAGSRPCLVVSDDLYNRGPSGKQIVLPITSTFKGIPLSHRSDAAGGRPSDQELRDV